MIKAERLTTIQVYSDDMKCGHTGVYKIFERLTRILYYWPKMKANVVRYVKRCKVCLAQERE